MHRRMFLRAALGASAFGLVTRTAGSAFAQATTGPAGVVYDPAPFGLGVASGDPLPDGVVLWTKLCMDPLTASFDGLAEVEEVTWEIARDAVFTVDVRRGVTTATPDFGYSVHVDVTDLAPSTHWFYRFTARGVTSVTGRTKTAPAPESDPGLLRIAHASCQAFGSGFYPLWGHVAREDLDLVVHLGDYIYEGGGTGLEGDRSHTFGDPQTLTDYRRRWAVYRGDPMLRWAHAAHPFACTWDDHEAYNDYSGAEKTARKQAAWQAWYEHMPIRATPTRAPFGFRLHRGLRYGTLLDIPMLDLRQHRRASTVIEAGQTVAGSAGIVAGEAVSVYDDPTATILGSEQKAWLKQRLAATGDRWSLWGNSIAIAQMRHPQTLALTAPRPGGRPAPVNHYWWPDQWDGYNVERTDVLGFLADNGIGDVVAVTGDFHAAWVAGLRPNFDDVSQPFVGVEFIGHSVTSSPYGVPASMVPAHDHFVWQDSSVNGYGVVEVTADALVNHFKAVSDKNTPSRSTVATLRSFVVARGTNRPVDAGVLPERTRPAPPAVPVPQSTQSYGA